MNLALQIKISKLIA